MKLYAIRDRLIHYYMTPFVAEHDKPVMHSLAALINNPENSHATSQAPQHFELWELADIDDETGHVTPTRKLICDCASLVRPGVRDTRRPEGGETPATPPGRPGTPTGGPGNTGAKGNANALSPPTAHHPAP